jgi:hypothetical protein
MILPTSASIAVLLGIVWETEANEKERAAKSGTAHLGSFTMTLLAHPDRERRFFSRGNTFLSPIADYR